MCPIVKGINDSSQINTGHSYVCEAQTPSNVIIWRGCGLEWVTVGSILTEKTLKPFPNFYPGSLFNILRFQNSGNFFFHIAIPLSAPI